MRPWRGFRMILDTENLEFFVAHPVIRRRRRRYNLDAKASLTKFPEDVVFYTEIECHDRDVRHRKIAAVFHLPVSFALDSPPGTEFILRVPRKRFLMCDRSYI